MFTVANMVIVKNQQKNYKQIRSSFIKVSYTKYGTISTTESSGAPFKKQTSFAGLETQSRQVQGEKSRHQVMLQHAAVCGILRDYTRMGYMHGKLQ